MLPGVTSGRLTRTDDGYLLSVVKGDSQFTYGHTGPLDREGLIEMVGKVQQELNLPAEGEAKIVVARNRVEAASGKRIKERKASARIQAVVTEQNGGFAITGTDSENIAGDPNGEHWIRATWDPAEFDKYSLGNVDRAYITSHTSAIAYKSQPGETPEIEFFANDYLAIRKFEMLRTKHGWPGRIQQNTDADVSSPANLQM